MQLYFCDRCSCRITEGELSEGAAHRFGSLNFCESCWRTDQVKAVIAKSTGLMAAVHEGGAGASTYQDGEEPAPERRRRSPSRGVRPITSLRNRKHPTPVDSRSSHRAHIDSGKHRPIKRQEMSGLWFAVILFGAIAMTTILLVGAAFLLA